MKKFIEWLLEKKLMEMPLTHYSYDFISKDDDGSSDFVIPPTDKQKFIGGQESLDKNKFQVYKYPDGRIRRAGATKFTKKDKAVLSHPRTARILEEKLKRVGFNFNILFIENRRMHSDYLENYLKEKGINKENSITFLQPFSSGHLLTPWMILHRIGHALMSSKEIGNYESFKKIFIDYFYYNDLAIKVGHKIDWELFYNNLEDIFMFKSIKNTNDLLEKPLLHNFFELIHELIAEYLWNGKIRINFNLPIDKKSQYQKGIEKIEELIKSILTKNVGKIIIADI